MSKVTSVFEGDGSDVQYKFETQNGKATRSGTDGSFSGWDLNHYLEVLAAREKQGIKKTADEVSAHPLLGKTVENATTGTQYVVEKVVRNWRFGSFLSAVLKDGRSHAVAFVENVNCVAPDTLEQIAEFQKNFRIVA